MSKNEEAKYSKREFEAVLVSSDADDSGDLTAGHFYYLEDSAGKKIGIASCLPNAEDKGASWGATMFEGYGERSHTWKWNGNEAKPSLIPSIHRVGHWHGWLQDGRFVLRRKS